MWREMRENLFLGLRMNHRRLERERERECVRDMKRKKWRERFNRIHTEEAANVRPANYRAAGVSELIINS